MTSFIIAAACLVCLDRMFFKGQLLSIFIDGAQAFLCRRGRPSATDRADPAEAMPPPALVITNRYANGHKRPAAAGGKQSVEGAAIFARQARSEPQMKGWSDLVVHPAIGEEGEMIEPEEPASYPAEPPTAKAELRDPEVVSLLGTLEEGERLLTGDATHEEMRAIENFDMRNYV
ncbi:hypothetical protein [uncultured Alistipes sp.]|uniref:hypothetical protein n=1 Tax=uncultured Alistipes sp. TaxID=538949 RepID=UPI002729B875|nr:hypothetical protein [uncultured Alistipes sp.]